MMWRMMSVLLWAFGVGHRGLNLGDLARNVAPSGSNWPIVDGATLARGDLLAKLTLLLKMSLNS